MKNLSHPTYLLCELETSLLMRGIQIGEMSKLGWLIGLSSKNPITLIVIHYRQNPLEFFYY
jgi:hypothetical protein